MQVEQVLSYYTQFRRAPIGRHHVQACRNVTCSMVGAERLIDHLAAKLGVAPGETTPDDASRCPRSSASVPAARLRVVMINDTIREHERGEDRRAPGQVGIACLAASS